MMRKPAAECYEWLAGGQLWSSCTACAFPVAGELSQPTRLLLGIFYPDQELILGDIAERESAAPNSKRRLLD
jgi:hypothetical protein